MKTNLLPAAWLFTVMVAVPALAGDRSADIRELTGRPTKLVWVQDAGDTACMIAERPTLRLMVLDTEDGKGERPLLPELGRYWRPGITDDGTRVVFGDKDKKTVSVVKFDGTGLRLLIENAIHEDVWQDPATGHDWVYATVTEPRDGKDVSVIRRYRLDDPNLDDPKKSELVWDRMPVNTFMVSGDGRAASAGGDGGNSPQGILTLPNGGFYARAGGCWPSMAPDASRRSWVFTGNHRSIHMCFPSDRSGIKSYSTSVDFTNVPGLVEFKGRQEAYHPRWSNNVRFFSLTAPLDEVNWSSDVKMPNRIAEKVELYIGRFAPDLLSAERFVKATENDRGDYYPNVWIEPTTEERAAAVAAAKTVIPAVPVDAAPAEPDDRGLVFGWDTGGSVSQITDPKTGQIRQCTGQLRGDATFGLHHVLNLRGGGFVPEAAAEPLLAACRGSNQFALEVILTSAGRPAVAEAVVFAFADDLAAGNVVLVQRGDELGLRLKTDDGPRELVPLGTLASSVPTHLIVSYSSGKLGIYFDGRPALVPTAAAGGLGSWTAQPVVFGDAWQGGRNWPGTLEGIAIMSREIPEAEARRRFERQRESRKSRRPVEPIVAELKLVGTCEAADPKAIAPYRRCLSVQHYEVAKVLKGKLDDKEITVAQWSVLDGKVFPGYGKFAKGQTYTLTLEPWEAHPEQESERMIPGDFDPTLPLLYDVTVPPAVAPKPATATWRGFRGDANSGGDWNALEPEAPWSAGLPPSPEDTAVLGPVAAGSREVTTTEPVVIRSLKLVQPDAAGRNRLKLGASLTITGNDAIAMEGTPEFDADGQPITLDAGSLKHVGLAGRVRFGGDGGVRSVVMLGGGDYRSAPAVEFRGDGRNAAGEAVMRVVSAQLTSLGAAYTAEPTVSFTEPEIAGGRIAKARAVVDKKSGALERLLLEDGGSGYRRPPTVTIEGGGGTGAQAEVGLAVAGVVVTRPGTGYTKPPQVAFGGGDGAGAEALAALQFTTLRYRDGQAEVLLVNSGTTRQDGAMIQFDWAAPGNNTGYRGWRNDGDWTLADGSMIFFESSTGRDPWFNGGVNTGTLRVGNGSRLGLPRLENRGTLELGAGTVLGQLVFAGREMELVNSGRGVIRVVGSSAEQPAAFGALSPEGNGKRLVKNGESDKPSETRFLIGTGKDRAVFRVQGGNVTFVNFGSAEIAAGATLALLTDDSGSSHKFNNREAKFDNSGAVRWAGRLQVQANHGGFAGIGSAGTITIEGDAVEFERLQSSCGPGGHYDAVETASRFVVTKTGTLEGTGRLRYLNATGVASMQSLPVRCAGLLSPGSAGGIGRLAFDDANLELSGTLRIDLAGPAPDPAKTDTIVFAGEGAGVIEIKPEAVLNVVPAAGFTPRGTFGIATARSVKGTFKTLHLNGRPTEAFTVNSLADGIEVVFK